MKSHTKNYLFNLYLCRWVLCWPWLLTIALLLSPLLIDPLPPPLSTFGSRQQFHANWILLLPHHLSQSIVHFILSGLVIICSCRPSTVLLIDMCCRFNMSCFDVIIVAFPLLLRVCSVLPLSLFQGLLWVYRIFFPLSSSLLSTPYQNIPSNLSLWQYWRVFGHWPNYTVFSLLNVHMHWIPSNYVLSFGSRYIDYRLFPVYKNVDRMPKCTLSIKKKE